MLFMNYSNRECINILKPNSHLGLKDLLVVPDLWVFSPVPTFYFLSIYQLSKENIDNYLDQGRTKWWNCRLTNKNPDWQLGALGVQFSLQIRIGFVRQRSSPTLEQTNINGQFTVPPLRYSFLLPCLLGTNICMSSLNGYPFRGRHRGQLACAPSLFSIAKWEFAIRILEKRFADAS